MILGLELLGGVMVALGGLFCITGGVGLLRLPDVYARLHGAGVADTLGAGLVMAGLVVLALVPHEGGLPGQHELLIAFKLCFILFFMWVTGTTACHALAKAAWLEGVDPYTVDGEGGSSKP